MDNLELSPEMTCTSCGAVLAQRDQFCSNCGKPVVNESPAGMKQDVFQILQPLLAYYSITLVILSVYKFTSLFPEGFEGMVLVSAIDIIVVLVFWAMSFNEVKPLFSYTDVRSSVMILTIVSAVLGGILIHFLADVIQVSITEDVFYNPYLFEDTRWPFALATLFICVQPAVFEEVAFRGFIFNSLQKLTPGMSAVYISSFVFGIIHMSIVSLIWLVPIGLSFAILRLRYQTLWYGIVGHFVYNFTITVLEFSAV